MQFMVLHLLIPAGLAGNFSVYPTALSQPSASRGHLMLQSMKSHFFTIYLPHKALGLL